MIWLQISNLIIVKGLIHLLIFSVSSVWLEFYKPSLMKMLEILKHCHQWNVNCSNDSPSSWALIQTHPILLYMYPSSSRSCSKVVFPPKLGIRSNSQTPWNIFPEYTPKWCENSLKLFPNIYSSNPFQTFNFIYTHEESRKI